jgi:hypothetical protein
VWIPAARDVPDHEACPDESRLAVVNCAAPSRNATDPLVTGAPDEVTFADRLTDVPAPTELLESDREVTVGDGVAACAGGDEGAPPPEQPIATTPEMNSRACKIQERLRPNISCLLVDVMCRAAGPLLVRRIRSASILVLWIGSGHFGRSKSACNCRQHLGIQLGILRLQPRVLMDGTI